MGLVAFATRRTVTIVMVTIAIVLFGSVALSRLEVTLLPDLSYPTLTVRTELTGAAPAEIETLIAKPIEEALSVIKNVRVVASTARSGQADVTLEFDWGTDMDFAVLDVREQLDALELPEEAERPLVLRFDPTMEPIVRLGLGLSGAGRGLDETGLKYLRRVAEEEVQRRLESVSGVAAVRISGGLEDEVQVAIDQRRLAQVGIPIETVVNRLRLENVNLSGGRVEQGAYRYLVRTLNQFQGLDDIRETILVVRDGRAIALGDVATVRAGHKEREAVIRVDGVEAVEVAIYKEGDANTVAVAERVRARADQLAEALPNEIALSVLYDQSRFIARAIDSVIQAGILGGLLAMIVLYLFLRSVWATLVISLAIPVSVIATFNLMYFSGISLNIMSLGGLALAIGLLVDSAIVVLENIARRRELGSSTLEAARRGAEEVAPAVTAATLTTIAVFFPLLFVQGVAGQLFAAQALVVTFALLMSLATALTLIPMLAARGTGALARAFDPGPEALPPAAQPPARGPAALAWGLRRRLVWDLPVLLVRLPATAARQLGRLLGRVLRPLLNGFDRAYGRLEQVYPRVLTRALRHRGALVLAALVVLVGSAALVPRIGVELIPALDQGAFYYELTLPPGTPIEQTDAVLARAHAELAEHGAVARLYSVAGHGNQLDTNPEVAGEHTAVFNVALAPDASADSEARVAALLRGQFDRVPGLDARFQRPTLFTLETPLEVEIAAYDLATLERVSAGISEFLRTNPRFVDVKSSAERGIPELQIRFDQERAADLGLLVADLAERVVSTVRGDVATRYRLSEREIDVRVRAQAQDRDTIAEIEQLLINPESGRPIPLSAVADIRLAEGPAEIRRVNQQRVAVLSANVAFGDLGSAVSALEQFIAQTPIDAGAAVAVTGQSDEMARSFASLQLALALAVFLVYLVMASQFESLLHPFVILFTIPLAAIGAIWALLLTGSVINVVVFIGLIMLAGIVVNNGIVLIDLINRLRDQGVPRQRAIVEGATGRLRPILMTTLTTTLGLLPLAIGIGDGAEMRAPMAITVIGGLLGSTALTLVVVPVVYSLFDRRGDAVAAGPPDPSAAHEPYNGVRAPEHRTPSA